MRELIYKQVAIDEMKNMYHAAEKWGREATDDEIKARAESCMASLIEMKLRIDKMPSAQPEIVRCKNCKYNPDNPRPFYDDDPVETYAWCKTEYFGEQGFCSCGKLAINLQQTCNHRKGKKNEIHGCIRFAGRL